MKKFLSSTSFLVNGLTIIGVILMLLGGWLLLQIFGERVPERYYAILFIIVLLFPIVGSIFTILRKEIPRWGLPSIKGKVAVIIGYFQVIVLCVGEIIFIYLFFTL